MGTSAIGGELGKQSLVRGRWEKLMEASTENLLEFLGQNEKWWEQAAVTCERTAADLASGQKEVWQLMGAVYRERAEKHAQIIERLRQAGDGARSQDPRGLESDDAGR
jgi:hypothetical protein